VQGWEGACFISVIFGTRQATAGTGEEISTGAFARLSAYGDVCIALTSSDGRAARVVRMRAPLVVYFIGGSVAAPAPHAAPKRIGSC